MRFVKFAKMKIPESKSIYYVGVQIILLILYFTPFIDYPFHTVSYLKTGSIVIGFFGLLVIVLAIIQLNKNLTPFPAPVENGTLIQKGLYKFVRHPIYSGIILSAIFFGVADGSTLKTSIGFALYVLFYFKSKYEESLLENRFPEYKIYKQQLQVFSIFITLIDLK